MVVDVCRPDGEPPIEVLGSQWRLRMEIKVTLHRAASVQSGSEQHSFPEVTDDRQVLLKVQVRDVAKNRAQKWVTEGPPIELTDQQQNVVAVSDVR